VSVAAGDEREPGLLLIDEIYDALEGDDPERALRLAHAALSAGDGPEDDPVVRFLAGVALLELDQPALAADELQRAVAFDPDDAEFRSHLSRACLRACRFAEASAHARAAVASDDTLADAHWALGLALEREGLPRGDFAAADACFARAAQLDAERYPAPVPMSRPDFEMHIAAAMDRLPAEYREHLARVALTVEDLPSDEVLFDEVPPLDPEGLLGLFVGTPIGDEGRTGDLPARILIFKRALERMALDRNELIEEIAVTVWHELGHYLGLDEDELERIDLA
jgi:predicted Zn-dependent protease with MMP-like domain